MRPSDSELAVALSASSDSCMDFSSGKEEDIPAVSLEVLSSIEKGFLEHVESCTVVSTPLSAAGVGQHDIPGATSELHPAFLNL